MAVIVSFLLISMLTVAAITGQLALYMAVFLFVAFKNLRHYVRERRKEEKSKQTTHHCVSCMDYHKILKSQSHLWNYYITAKRANRDLREDIRKLTKQLEDKDLALEQITKKYTSLKREVHVKDEKLKYGKQQCNQLEEELTNKVTSLEETLNKKEQGIRQHEEALKTAIEHVISDLDDLCTIHNDSLEQSVDETSNLNHETCHLPSPTESGVCLPTPKEEEDFPRNDITDLSDVEEAYPPDHHYNAQYTHHALVTNNLFIDEWNYYYYIPMEATSYCSQVSTDIPPLDFIPHSLEISKYHDRLVVSPVFPPFPPPPPVIELHLIPT